jgi:hypothetical protein
MTPVPSPCCSPRHITQFLGLGCFQCGSLPQVRSSIFMVEEYVGKRCLKKLLR